MATSNSCCCYLRASLLLAVLLVLQVTGDVAYQDDEQEVCNPGNYGCPVPPADEFDPEEYIEYPDGPPSEDVNCDTHPEACSYGNPDFSYCPEGEDCYEDEKDPSNKYSHCKFYDLLCLAASAYFNIKKGIGFKHNAY